MSSMLSSVYSFREIRDIFPATDDFETFCLLTFGEVGGGAQFVFSCSRPRRSLRTPGRRFTLTSGDIALLNPKTRTCPIFRTSQTPS